MSDPGSSLTRSLHKRLAQATHLLDDHIRVVQYGIYGLAAVGVWRVLHSARAFSHFTRVEDIPHDFIRKNVRLSGRVRSLGTTAELMSSAGVGASVSRTASTEAARLAPPVSGETFKAVTSAPNLQTTLSGDTSHDDVSSTNNNSNNATNQQRRSDRVQEPPPSSAVDSATENITLETIAEKMLTDGSGGVGGADSGPSNDAIKGTPVNRSSSITGGGPREDSDLSNADYRPNNGLDQPRRDRLQHDGYQDMARFKPLFMEVEHVPVFRLPHHNPEQLLALKLAAVEVPVAAHETLSRRLANQRVWFRLLYVDAASGALVCAVTRSQFGFGAWRTLNEEIVRTGEGVVSRLADTSDAAPLATSLTLRQRARAALSALWSGAPSAGALALVDDQRVAGQKVLPPVIPDAYHKLFGKLLQSEARARRKRLGVWKEEDSRGGVNLQRSFLVRLWNRFRNNTREMKSKNG